MAKNYRGSKIFGGWEFWEGGQWYIRYTTNMRHKMTSHQSKILHFLIVYNIVAGLLRPSTGATILGSDTPISEHRMMSPFAFLSGATLAWLLVDGQQVCSLAFTVNKKVQGTWLTLPTELISCMLNIFSFRACNISFLYFPFLSCL